jgi:hypothetical protein
LGVSDGDAVGYARLYGPLAVVGVMVAFFPLVTVDSGTLWTLATRAHGGSAVLGLLLIGALVVLLTHATFRPARTRGVPIGIAVLAGILAVMLITKPGAGAQEHLTPFGNAALAIASGTFALAISHVVRLRKR